MEEVGDQENGVLSVCCSSEQIQDMTSNFVMTEALLSRCPTCLNNFKKNFCDLTCRPDQSSFANASQIIRAKDFKGEEKDMVKEITYYVTDEFPERVLDSCKNVQNPAFGGSVLDLLCGPWGSTWCTPRRWFTYLGSISNGYSPFNILYHYGSEPVGPFFPHNPEVTPCHESTQEGEPGCSCTDCESACVPPTFPEIDREFVLFNGINGVTFIMIIVFSVGTIMFLAVNFVSAIMKSPYTNARKMQLNNLLNIYLA